MQTKEKQSTPTWQAPPGSDSWTEDQWQIYWMKEQHATEHMRGPWEIEESWGQQYSDDSIRVVYRKDGGLLIVVEWKMNGVRKWSPAYYLIRAHAERISAMPELFSAVTQMIELWDSDGDSGFPLYDEAQAAITKATGGAK